MTVISDRMRMARAYRGISQKQLSKLAGVHEVTISRIATGQFTPNVDTLERISSALGVSIDYLLGKSGDVK